MEAVRILMGMKGKHLNKRHEQEILIMSMSRIEGLEMRIPT